MASQKMIRCKVCGEAVARNAQTCPHCGAKLKMGSGCLVTVLRVLILPIILFVIYLAWVQYSYQKAVKETVDAYTQAVDEATQSYTDAVSQTVEEFNKAFSGN